MKPSPKAITPDAPCFSSALRLKEYMQKHNLCDVDARDWNAEWKERWVVFVDLIAFSSRSMRSRDVVLNNIIRFDHASSLAKNVIPNVRVFRFSDSTFGVADEYNSALAFGIAIHHACLALNAAYMDRARNPLFIHTITPRVTIAYGSVLGLPETSGSEKRFEGIDPRTLIAGAGIVNAHELEKYSSGGLCTVSADGAKIFASSKLHGGATSTHNYIRSWQRKYLAANTPLGLLYIRNKLLDIPWLLLRPVQHDTKNLCCAEWPDAVAAIGVYLKLWELGAREFYSPAGINNPLETSKHFSAAIRHGINCAQARAGQFIHRYYTTADAHEMLRTGRAGY